MPDCTLIFDGLNIPHLDLADVYETRPPKPGGTFFINATAAQDLRFDPNFHLYDGAVGEPCRVERTRDGKLEVCGGILARIDPVRVHMQGAGWSAG
jgi:hypothetical protein